ncbi:ABC transporter ATP-binding protein [Rhizobium rosettiformans]|uniref:ABC transporter ATP-binding protein n=1 Tax=Rhizobium rosettiformans TaxID=1368430 RepID=UPI002858A7FE|nr:sn-glycerol-3-phosphate ABC transporter ATP-binding protein UgpC [Rhizobium rosettiformans]MDR7031001.1 multiple sugar transport system ATP-binding protein [Rhizobium rosettiformans]MDR7066780.1 multiple sugar transport system ATP-binding protein [Rhizobium rosettiformans]
MATVSFDGTRKAFGAHEVLKGVSLDVADGEFVILVGPSGCGKSTLLRMLAGLEQATDGDIRIDGRSVIGVSPKDRDIAMVFQTYALYPHMTVAENMGFSLRLAKAPKAEADARIQTAANMLDLGQLLDRYPKQLSGGQRQRVAMGRAIVRDPKVFLFDEPLSNLDAKLRVQMRAEIKALHQRLKTTSIYVTHDQVEAMTMADRIVVMNGGKIEQVGTPLELYDSPANVFVAGFIGSPSMNFLKGSIERQSGTAVFRSEGGFTLPLPPGAIGAQAGQPVVYGVRPEHIGIARDNQQSHFVPLIEVVEPTGSETVIVAEHAAGTITVSHRGRGNYRPGDPLPLIIEPSVAHVFDQSTGRRVAGN